MIEIMSTIIFRIISIIVVFNMTSEISCSSIDITINIAITITEP